MEELNLDHLWPNSDSDTASFCPPPPMLMNPRQEFPIPWQLWMEHAPHTQHPDTMQLHNHIFISIQHTYYTLEYMGYAIPHWRILRGPCISLRRGNLCLVGRGGELSNGSKTPHQRHMGPLLYNALSDIPHHSDIKLIVQLLSIIVLLSIYMLCSIRLRITVLQWVERGYSCVLCL